MNLSVSWTRIARLFTLALLALSIPWQSIGAARGQESVKESKREVLPIPPAPFVGIAKETLNGSTPQFNPSTQAPKDAPNILLVLLDDAGFGNPAPFGGPVQTPIFERLAKDGLRYNRFHVAGLCSPSRAALLSGRNHHSIGFGSITELATGWPGYSSLWPRNAASISQVLRHNGYSTSAFGKWHLTPDHQQGPAGPFDRWPNALGFDYFWGFLGAEAGQYDPLLAENNRVIGVPNEKNYYFPDAMSQQAIDWIRGQQAQAPDKPFFIYFAPGATHAPHHVPKEWADKYKGKFDQGWDKLREETFARQKQLGIIPADTKLTPRDPAFPAWDSLPKTQKALYSRQMEVFAGFQENADVQVGKVIHAIEKLGKLDNTLVIYIFGDNGASLEGTPTGTFNEIVSLLGLPISAQQQHMAAALHGGIASWGGPKTNPHYAAGWAWAGNTPFQWGKQIASHLGAIRSPMVISWPKRIKERGAIRSQFTHLIDVVPTILEAVGLPEPKVVDGADQLPIQGKSFLDTLDNPNANSKRTTQYFAILGNRSIYHDGWLLSTRLPKLPWDGGFTTFARFAPGKWDPQQDPVELYHLDNDFSQAEDVSAKYPEKVRELQKIFQKQATENNVFPLLAEYAPFFGIRPPESDSNRFVFPLGVENIGPGMIPRIYARSYVIHADLEIPAAGAEGVLVAEGSNMGGFAFYVEEGKLKHTLSLYGLRFETISSASPLPTGKLHVRYEFQADEENKPGTGGKTTLYVNDEKVAEGRLQNSVAFRFSLYAGMDIGKDNGFCVSPSYAAKAPFAFSGKLEKVEFELK
jgi:arylsulfatase